MKGDRWKVPPSPEARGQRELSACQSGREANSDQRIERTAQDVNRGRSVDHPTYYHVGHTLHGERVYWHPQQGLAVEKDCSYLLELPNNATVDWLIPDELWAALAVNPDLHAALPADLLDLIDWAEDCARERDGMIAAANASLIRTEVV